MSVKLKYQHVDHGTNLTVHGVHQAMDAAAPVAAYRYPSVVVHLVAVLFPHLQLHALLVLGSQIQLLQHIIDM